MNNIPKEGGVQQLKIILWKHKFLTIATLVAMVVFVDSISHHIDPETSWFTQLTDNKVKSSIARSVRYLEMQTALETDEAVLALRLGADVRADQIALPGDPFFRLNDVHFGPRRVTVFGGMPSVPGESYVLLENVKSFVTDLTDDVMYKSLYCDREHYDETDVRKLLAIVDGEGGYGDTHALLGVRMIYELGCWEDVPVEEEQMIARIVAAQEDAPVNDLFVERVTLLYWAGAGDQVRQKWIDQILAAQNMDGGYAYEPGESSDPHTTALAAMALTYFDEGKKHQSVILGL